MIDPADLDPALLWLRAFANPPGIKLKVSDLIRAKSLLYTARTKLRDPDLAHLELRTSPVDPKGEIWIINPGLPELNDI